MKILRSCIVAAVLFDSIASRAFAAPPAEQAIGPAATVVTGINATGTVRACNLANLEALLNLSVNGIEILSILVSTFMLFRALKPMETRVRIRLFALSVLVLAGGLSTPGIINSCIAVARDANLFS